MAFESLGERLDGIFKKLRGKGRVSEKDIAECMREVRIALLEADVNFKVVREFLANVSEKALGADVLESLTPGQYIIKIVRDELCELLGGTSSKIAVSSRPPTIIMLAGLQGAGKTTMCAKLAAMLKRQGKNPVLVACDVYRPAAVKQLHVVGDAVGVTVISDEKSKNPVEIAKNAVQGLNSRYDTVILDTAGRLHIDEGLMRELSDIKSAVGPHEILLVVDAMTGQDAVNVAQTFNESLGIDGIIITKLDGDTRGGAALSVRNITGKPIKFVGMGEKLDTLEPFYPDRMASRILGMGDVLTLIDKAQENFDQKKAKELEKKLREQSFDFNDFLDQIQQMKKMGPISQLVGMIPGVKPKDLDGIDIDDNAFKATEAIILSMTKKERENPGLINGSRKRRIALGSGTEIREINMFLKQFDQMKQMMKQLSNNKMLKQRAGLAMAGPKSVPALGLGNRAAKKHKKKK